ncbi:MAG: arylsulfatase [Pirellulaceae bacterium]
MILQHVFASRLFSFLLAFGLPTGMVTCVAHHATADDHPNVIVFLSDDQGWGDLSLNGNKNLSTPNIDSLARDGAQFDRFYVCPVCSPTRAEFLTGRYHPRSGVYSTSAGGERMDLDESTIADSFRASGYRTGAFGKWHNGMQYPYHPIGRGFDEYYGFCSGHWGDYFSPPLEHNGKLVQGEGFCIDDFTNHALTFMKSSVDAEKPFFAYLPYNTPHAPMQVPDAYWDRFKDKELSMLHRQPDMEQIDHTRCALAMCENIDWNVGRVLRKLDDWKIADNTIVLYFCDNGPNGWRFNGGMKGRKGSTDEGGVRSPLVIRWPNKIAAGKVIKPIGAAIDLLPTLAELAGVEIVSTKPLDGRSLAPLLISEPASWPDRMIVSHWNKRVSVRNQRFRLDHQGALFDIEADPGQSTNVAAKFASVARSMQQAADTYKAEVLPGYNDDQRPFPLDTLTLFTPRFPLATPASAARSSDPTSSRIVLFA